MKTTGLKIPVSAVRFRPWAQQNAAGAAVSASQLFTSDHGCHVPCCTGVTRALVALLALVAVLGLGCGDEGPVEPSPSSCSPGALRACSGCGVGALRTNLSGLQRCAAGPDGGVSWGPCACSGDGGP